MKLSSSFKKDILTLIKNCAMICIAICIFISIGGFMYQVGLDIENNIALFMIVGIVYSIVFALIAIITTFVFVGMIDFANYAIKMED